MRIRNKFFSYVFILVTSFFLAAAQYIPPNYPPSLNWLYEKYQIEEFFNQINFSHESFILPEYNSIIDHAQKGNKICIQLLYRTLYPYLSKPTVEDTSLESLKPRLYEKSFLERAVAEESKILIHVPQIVL